MTKKELLLIQLMEECAEIQQAVAKYLRFGKKDSYRELPTNEVKLHEEICDLIGMLNVLEDEKIVNISNSDESEKLIEAKIEKVYTFLEYSKQRGILKEEDEH